MSRANEGDELIAKALLAGAYTADNAGNVWIERPRGSHRRVARATKMKDGYLRMWVHIHGRKAAVLVHRIVAIAWHGMPQDCASEVNHKNGLKSDNRPDNLEWVTPSQNTRHASATGLRTNCVRSGELNGRAKLTRAQVDEIAIRRANGERLAAIAASFGISLVTVSKIARGKAWA